MQEQRNSGTVRHPWELSGDTLRRKLTQRNSARLGHVDRHAPGTKARLSQCVGTHYLLSSKLGQFGGVGLRRRTARASWAKATRPDEASRAACRTTCDVALSSEEVRRGVWCKNWVRDFLRAPFLPSFFEFCVLIIRKSRDFRVNMVMFDVIKMTPSIESKIH